MSKKQREAQAQAAAGAQPANRWADYFWANLIFFVFLFVLAYVVRLSCASVTDEPAVKQAVDVVLDQTFHFLLLLMGGGFLLVTLFDASYEHFNALAAEQLPAEEVDKA